MYSLQSSKTDDANGEVTAIIQPRHKPFAFPSREDRFAIFNGAVRIDFQDDPSQFQRREYSSEADLLSALDDALAENSTRIIICVRSRDPRDGLLPLPLSKEAYGKLAEVYGFAGSLGFKVLYTGLATICRFSSESTKSYIFQQNATGRCSLSMLLSYDPSKKTAVALVFGARMYEANAFISTLSDRCRIPHWSTLALAALEMTAEDFSSEIKLRHNDIWEIGRGLKVYSRQSIEEGVAFDVKQLDLFGTTRALNRAFIKLAYHSQVCQTSQSLLRDIENMAVAELEDGEVTAAVSVRDHIQFLRSWYDGIQARSDYLTRRAEAMLQSVDSLISQRDSAINLEISQRSSQVAEQSKAIAELSRQDNIAMREVAIATAKDSATMRVIAAVTLFFLPPTFLATFFSASYFDFKPSQPGGHVSVWLWLYFVLSVILLVAVMGFWKVSTRQKLKNIP